MRGEGRYVRTTRRVDKGRPCNAMSLTKRPALELLSRSTCNCSIARKGRSAMQFTVQSLRRWVVVRASRVAMRVPTQSCQVWAETSHILLSLNKKKWWVRWDWYNFCRIGQLFNLFYFYCFTACYLEQNKCMSLLCKRDVKIAVKASKWCYVLLCE